jgi:DNA-binding response OmpR family regulator
MSGSLLIVEDDIMIREALTEVLADEGYSVMVAPNGRELLALLKSSYWMS